MCPRVRETHMSEEMLRPTRISLAVYANPRPRKTPYGLYSSLLEKEGTQRWGRNLWVQKSDQDAKERIKRAFKCASRAAAGKFTVSRVKIKLR
jgi:hypothetical protein